MLELIGSTALSAFRKKRLLKKLTRTIPLVKEISAEYIHFADVEEALTDSALSTLKRILTYGPKIRSHVLNQVLV